MSINLEKDSIEAIHKFYVERLEFIYEQMLHENLLCEPYSHGVVIELGFKGNLETVKADFKSYIEHLKDLKLEEGFRTTVINQMNRFRKYRKYVANNPFKRKITELYQLLFTKDRKDSDNLVRDIEKCRELIKKNQMSKHDKKECLCFFN